MLEALPAVLCLLLLGSLLGAFALYLAGRRAAACTLLGLGLLAVAAGAVLALALNPDPGTNATGLVLLAAVTGLGLFVLSAARVPARQPAALAAGLLTGAALVAALVYLLVGFRIF